jgi:hypothetical protein
MDETLKLITDLLWPYALRGDRDAILALMAAARLEESTKMADEFRAVIASLQLRLSELQTAAARLA